MQRYPDKKKLAIECKIQSYKDLAILRLSNYANSFTKDSLIHAIEWFEIFI